jgi:hypothetical protein
MSDSKRFQRFNIKHQSMSIAKSAGDDVGGLTTMMAKAMPFSNVKVPKVRMSDGVKKLTAMLIPELSKLVLKKGTPEDVLKRILKAPRRKQVLMGIMKGRLQLNGKPTALTRFKMEMKPKKPDAVAAEERAVTRAYKAKCAAQAAAIKLEEQVLADKLKGWTLATLLEMPHADLMCLSHVDLVHVLGNSGVSTRSLTSAFIAANLCDMETVERSDDELQILQTVDGLFCDFKLPLSCLTRATLLQYIFLKGGRPLLDLSRKCAYPLFHPPPAPR